MRRRKLRIRATRLEPELDRRIEIATKQGGFSNPSAFIRAAIERELTGRESESMPWRSGSPRVSTA